METAGLRDDAAASPHLHRLRAGRLCYRGAAGAAAAMNDRLPERSAYWNIWVARKTGRYPPLHSDAEIAVRVLPAARARGYDPSAVHQIAPTYGVGRRYWPHEFEWKI